MRRDYAERAEAAAELGDGKDCNGCSWNVDIFGQAPCELPAVTDKSKFCERKGSYESSNEISRKQVEHCEMDYKFIPGTS